MTEVKIKSVKTGSVAKVRYIIQFHNSLGWTDLIDKNETMLTNIKQAKNAKEKAEKLYKIRNSYFRIVKRTTTDEVIE